MLSSVAHNWWVFALGGSAAAAVGRAVFAWLVARFTSLLPADARKNAKALMVATAGPVVAITVQVDGG